MQTSNVPDTEFKTLVIRILNDLSKNFNKEIVSIKKGYRNHKKKDQSEMKNTKLK